jgi:NodT family efflux transporter outer membrane factor (OMF) lipoprotein
MNTAHRQGIDSAGKTTLKGLQPVWLHFLAFVAVLGVALLAGCAVGPDYHPPKTSVPTQWSSPLAGGETNRASNLAAWWQNFGDTNLDALMHTAVQSNLTLRAAEARVREARAERAVVAGGLWPEINGSASYSRNRFSAHGFPPLGMFGVPLDYNLYTAGFDAAWELDVFGGTRRAVESASAELGAAQSGRADVLVSLLAEVARNYIGARGDQQRLAITRQNLQVQQEILDLTSNRFANGLTSDLDVQQATAVLTSTEAQVPLLESDFAQAVHHLAVLLGQPPGALLEKMSAVEPIPVTPPAVPAGLPSDLLQRRPDVARSERELASATARIGVAKADLFPKFSLTGFADLQSISANNWFHYASRAWSAGPTVQWELFQAGSIRANVRVQNARQEDALNRYQQTVLAALEDAENALTAYAKEQVRREALSQSVQANRQAIELSTQLYKSGLADFLSVLDSERSLYAAEDALVQSDQAVSVDLVQLYKALGGGWPAPGLDP